MTMSHQEQFNPYLNRFTQLVKEHATAKLDFSCLDGKVTVNLLHDLGVVGKAPPATAVDQPENGHILKKNVSLSQIIRLKKRAAERAEKAKHEVTQAKARNEAEKDKNMTTKAVEDVEAEKAKTSAEKAILEAEKAKFEADESKNEAAKAIS